MILVHWSANGLKWHFWHQFWRGICKVVGQTTYCQTAEPHGEAQHSRTMKRLITSIVAMAAIIGASAMSYSQAREQAWFLTDKMAFELYLTAPQVSAVYEINLDYIMNVDFMGDIFGTYWERRTRELSFVLTRSQMHTFLQGGR